MYRRLGMLCVAILVAGIVGKQQVLQQWFSTGFDVSAS
jgi:hypothetical protein